MTPFLERRRDGRSGGARGAQRSLRSPTLQKAGLNVEAGGPPMPATTFDGVVRRPDGNCRSAPYAVRMLGASLAIFGVVASVIGIYAFVDARRDRRVKLLAFSRISAFPLATATSLERGYHLSIHYQAPDMTEAEEVEAAYASHLRFANFGKEPIRREDIASASPLRVEVEGGHVLDISLASTRRGVSRIAVDRPSLEDDRASAEITFDFLDHRDGAVLTILSTTPEIRARLVGEIIGMPGGIIDYDVPPARGFWSKLGVSLIVVGELAAYLGAAYVTKSVAGSWTDVWLLALPVTALLVPLVIALIVSETIWPSRPRKFPDGLPLPGWSRSLIHESAVRSFEGYWEWFPETKASPDAKTEAPAGSDG